MKTKESFDGITTMFRKIDKDSEYKIEGGDNHILISDLGSERYQCTGTCFCDDDRNDERRILSSSSSSLPLIKKSIFYLVTAVSSSFAISKSKEYFNEQCFNTLKEECPPNAILADVDKCDKITEKDREDIELLLRTEEYKRYECKGNCLIRQFLFSHEDIGISKPSFENEFLPKIKKQSKEYGCHRMELKKEVSGVVPGKKFLEQKSVHGVSQLNYITLVFTMKELDNYCRDKSSVSFNIKEKDREIPLCVGHIGYSNPTVECKEIINNNNQEKKM